MEAVGGLTFIWHQGMYNSHDMMTSSNGNIFRVTGPLCGEFTSPGEFPAQRPVTRSFDVFFHLRLNKRLSKQPWGWWFETTRWSLWRHRNDDTGSDQMSMITSQNIMVLTTKISRVPGKIKHNETDAEWPPFRRRHFKTHFLNENIRISIAMSLRFVPRGPINNIPASVQIMAWRRPGDKPSSELMMVRLPTHICVTRPQWDNE